MNPDGEVVEVVDFHVWTDVTPIGDYRFREEWTTASRAAGDTSDPGTLGVPLFLESFEPVPAGCSATVERSFWFAQIDAPPDTCLQLAVAVHTQDRTVRLDGSPGVPVSWPPDDGEYGVLHDADERATRFQPIDGLSWACGSDGHVGLETEVALSATTQSSPVVVTFLPRQQWQSQSQDKAHRRNTGWVGLERVALVVSCPDLPAPTCTGEIQGVPTCGRCWRGDLEGLPPAPRYAGPAGPVGVLLRGRPGRYPDRTGELTLLHERLRPTWLIRWVDSGPSQVLAYEWRPYMDAPFCCGDTPMPRGTPTTWGPDPCAFLPWPERTPGSSEAP